MYNEIKDGDYTLGIQDEKLHAHVKGVAIKCFYTNAQGERFQLTEEKQIFKNGHVRKRGLKFVAEKLQFDETPEQGAFRGLAEELQILGPDIYLTAQFEENKCDTIESIDYKNIQTTYKTWVFACEIPKAYYREFYMEEQCDKQTYFSWIKL